MSDDEPDYLSDKFLAQLEATSKSQQPKSYTERRKQALKQSQLLNEQNRKKSRKQMELEAREEGLLTSLIQKAQEEAKESGKQNKALAIMMKMGFKPGQSLGESHGESSSFSPIDGNLGSVQTIETSGVAGERYAEVETSTLQSEPRTSAFAVYKHRAEPLPIKEWSGKTGIGGVKRPPSPSALERVAKMAKQSEVLSADEFRDRARKEYEDRRAEGKLSHARTTCVNLDAKADVKFNRFWVDPTIPESFPLGLLEALEELLASSSSVFPDPGPDGGMATRLKAQMQTDALRPLDPGPIGNDEDGDDERPLRMRTGVDSDRKEPAETTAVWPEETLLQVSDYLRLSASQRLEQVLDYLRSTYYYCFWCGTQYVSVEELEAECPGLTEEGHD
ncbi:hypothetical protein BDM02DRAFT_3094437 [Thelephora ganbajun]|uniref:Uncharacterized protein n=1 Tax=Thelephora ganbajun TaxID=370292 RepID=A0ACB6ZJB4_THEGA|nr:hypothetical protein BDM02DRAFT_3094437 [Thelephora ganbajun]